MEPIQEKIKEMFLRIFPELTSDTFDFTRTQDQFEQWDSFSHMQLVAAVEQDHGVTLQMEEIVAIRTPQDFVELVKKKKAL